MDFNKVIDRYGTYCTQWDYVADRFGKAGILPFTISDMDFPCPPEIIAELTRRLEHPIFGYTRWNHDDFKGAIQSWYAKRFSTIIEQEHIVYSPSVIYTVGNLIALLAAEGEHVIVQTPCYDGFPPLVAAKKCQFIANPLIAIDGRFYFDFADLEQKLRHEKAKVLLLCSPHNPTGRVWTEAELRQVVELCRKYGVWIISDEIHMDIVHEPNYHIPIVNLVTEGDGVCICTSASKTFNVSGLGGSYALIPNSHLKEQFLIMTKASGLSSASIFGLHSTMVAYNQCDYWVDALCAYLNTNMVFVKAYLARYIPEIKFTLPEATYLAWLNISNLPWTMDELQVALVQKGEVAFMNGAVYGDDNYLRINVGAPRRKIEAGLNRLQKAIDYLRQTSEY